METEDPERRIRAVAFFDTKSQLSFMSTSLLKRLSLNSAEEEELNIRPLGSKRPSKCKAAKAKAGTEMNAGETCLLGVNVTDYLSNKLQMVSVDKEKIQRVAKQGQVCGLQEERRQPDLHWS